MAKNQRIKNDLKTDNRREAADKALSHDRERNDALTQENRFQADKTMSQNRARNDEITANRRELKDAKSPDWAFGFFIVALAILAISAYILFT